MLMLLFEGLAGMAVVMALAWLVQYLSNNAGWVDVVWTFGTGLLGIFLALNPTDGAAAPTWRQVVVAALVAIWAVRLGLYVAVRVGRSPEDRRYTLLRQRWGDKFQFTMFWFLEAQAVASALLGISIVLAARNPAPDLRWNDVVGIAILVIAILGEGLADRQLARFKADPQNHGRICDAGLWRWSRHPNYFFEWFGWLAYPCFAISVSGYPSGWLSFVGPILMYLILRYASGVPFLEEQMLRSRGEAYRTYQRQTSMFFPMPPRRISA
jgi:steroid 5-alpha reductase family enzyme